MMLKKNFIPDEKDHLGVLRKQWNDWCWSKRSEIAKIMNKAQKLILKGDEHGARKAVWDALQAIEDFNRWWRNHGPKDNVVLKK